MDDRMLVLIAVYLLPTLAAYARKHVNRDAIAAVNVLFGWTLIGWMVALIWSMTGNTEGRRARIVAEGVALARDPNFRN